MKGTKDLAGEHVAVPSGAQIAQFKPQDVGWC
jgi:hypothetical protein